MFRLTLSSIALAFALPRYMAAASQATDGFVELDMDMPAVKWEETEKLEGKIIDTDTFASEERNKRVFIIDVKGEPHRLIEQPGLRRLFEKAKVGDTVRVEVNGFRDLGDNKQMRVFKVSVKQGASRSPQQQQQDREQRAERPSRGKGK